MGGGTAAGSGRCEFWVDKTEDVYESAVEELQVHMTAIGTDEPHQSNEIFVARIGSGDGRLGGWVGSWGGEKLVEQKNRDT